MAGIEEGTHRPTRVAWVLVVGVCLVKALLVGGAVAGQGDRIVVSGRVIDGVSGEAVPGAEISVSGDTTPYPQGRRAVSASNGSFQMALRPGARVSIVARRTGYIGGVFGQLVPGDPGRFFVARTDGQITSLSLRLWKLSVVSGRVIDAQNEPMVGVKVEALRRRTAGPHVYFTKASASFTNDRGEFRLTSLEPGPYAIAVSATQDDRERSGYPTTYAPGVMRSDQALILDLMVAQELTNVQVVVETAGGHAIRGVVKGPLPRRPTQAELLSDVMSPLPVALTSVDDAGLFTFRHVQPGSYVVRILDYPASGNSAAKQGTFRYSRPMGNEALPVLPTDPTLWAEHPVIVNDSDRDIQFELRPAGRISGHVSFSEQTTRLTPEQFSRMAVMALPPDGRTLGQRLAPIGRIGADGAFMTVGLPPGPYMLAMIPDPLTPGDPLFIQAVTVRGTNLPGNTIQLGTEDLTSVEILLGRATAQVAGVVTDREGRRISEATVYLFPHDRQLWAELGPGISRLVAVRPEADGTITVEAVPPGEYLIAAVSGETTEDWRDAAFLERLAPLAERTTLAPNGSASLRLTAIARPR